MENCEAVYRFFEVVIVGGGIAGLSAADMLYKNGITNFTIIEARSRLGGRMYSEQLADGSFIDYGAQYIHGGSNANSIFSLANSKGLLDSPPKKEFAEDFENFYTSKGRKIQDYNVEKAIEMYEDIEDFFDDYYKENEEDISIADNNIASVFEKAVRNVMRDLRNSDEADEYDIPDVELVLRTLGRTEWELEMAGENKDVGLTGAWEYVDLPGGDVTIPKGTQSIINTFGNQITSRVQMPRTVTKIEWNNNKVTTYTSNNCKIESKHIIVTLPLGVIKKGSVQFQPALDARKKTAIQNLSPGKAAKIILLFDTPYWQKGDGYLVFSWTEQEKAAGKQAGDWKTGVSLLHEVSGVRNALAMWVVGDFAEMTEKLSDQQILSAAAELLRKFTGNPSISTPTRVKRHNWISDPLTLGAWSYPTPRTNYNDFSALQVPLPSKRNPRVLLAGEYTHPKYFSTMHGARSSGMEQALKIIQFKKNQG